VNLRVRRSLFVLNGGASIEWDIGVNEKMDIAATWCDVVECASVAITCLSGLLGGVFAYRKWQHERRLERSKTLKDILETLEKTKLCQLVNQYDTEGNVSEWFTHLTDDSEREIANSFRYLSYVCYLYEQKLLVRDEFVLFESQIKSVLYDKDARRYLFDTPIESDGDACNGPFAYLIRYAKGIGIGLREMGDSRCSVSANVKDNVNSAHGDGAILGESIRINEFRVPTAVIKINQKYRSEMSEKELYEVTSGWWRVNKDVVKQIQIVLAVAGGEVKSAYRVFNWHYQPGMTSGRMAFEGVLDDEVSKLFCGRSVRELFPRGAANPIRYFCIGTSDSSAICMQRKW